MTKIIKHRKLRGLESEAPHFAQIGQPGNLTLAEMLRATLGDKVYVCGPLDAMTREWMEPPEGWRFGREFAFKHRTAVYKSENTGKEITVKLASHRESWFPGCEDAKTACDAWRALREEWKSTGLPLLSSPAATGKALLWENLPFDKEGNAVEFPFLPDDLAVLIRANSPQHRLENFNNVAHLDWFRAGADMSKLIQHDGRWMYAAMCSLDRFPIGEPKRVGGFVKYQPGIYLVVIRIPDDWNHIGLIPARYGDDGGWVWPDKPGYRFCTWAFEPELTLALKHGWEICDVHDGYSFEKGRPLLGWSKNLIEMREHQQWLMRTEDEMNRAEYEAHKYAASAVRQILNHTIGAMHRNDFERETFVSDDNFRQWRRENPDLAGSELRTPEKVEGGYLVPTFVQDTSQFSIFMPHWTSTLYSLARARVAEWALLCDPSTLVKINGDAIYSTVAQPELDKLNTQRLGQPRRK